METIKELVNSIFEESKSDKTKQDIIDAAIQIKGDALEAAGRDGVQDQLSNRSIKTTHIMKNGKRLSYTAKGVTRQEAFDRINHGNKDDGLDLEARKKIVNAGGKIESNLVSKAKDAIDNTTIGNEIRPITQHIANNAGIYGATAAGLGAYGLYKYIKKKRQGV